ncbi:MAG: hypothetical protein H6937_03955 [Burkholderiales bacterium]|nr:hypothetical protein [Burkholderiales bacterium]
MPAASRIMQQIRLLTGIQEVSEMLASVSSDINSLLMLVLETLYRSLGFHL